jgi:hypothetical protein
MPRPVFSTAWQAAQRVYKPGKPGAVADHVAQLTGGDVARFIRAKVWINTCAVRMSYILNSAGVQIPSFQGKTERGAAGLNYFYRVRDLSTFLQSQWGPAETIPYPPAQAWAARKGIILFSVHGWSTASGHATLFDGSACYDRCYFYEPEATYRTSRANFWELP